MMESGNIIFIVLGASLIIWFVFLFFIIRTDGKLSQLEEIVNQKTEESDHET